MSCGQEWTKASKAESWVSRRPDLPRRSEAEQTIIEDVLPQRVARVLDRNYDVVASPTRDLHERAQAAFGFEPEDQDPSDRPAPLQDQLEWLSDAGFTDVDCYWKWLELTVTAGTKPQSR